MSLVVAIVVVVGVVGAFLRREYRRAQIGDSDTFLRVLDIWAPALNALDPTPRHYIRMLNQLRLLSMRMRLERRELTKPAQRTALNAGASQVKPMSDEDRKVIHTTVLSALHELGVDAQEFRQLISTFEDQPGNIDKAVTGIKSSNLSDAEFAQAQPALSKSIKQHLEEFPGIWPGKDDISEFRAFMRGVQLS